MTNFSYPSLFRRYRGWFAGLGVDSLRSRYGRLDAEMGTQAAEGGCRWWFLNVNDHHWIHAESAERSVCPAGGVGVPDRQ